MNIPSERIAAVEALGYTPEEARFLYLVAAFSGYFVPRQFIEFVGVKWGKRSDHFTAKLESRGHATWREYPHLNGVYHLFSKTLYRAIDNEHVRNRRRHSTEFIRTRLVLLDFVLTNQGYNYLETENEKVSYFSEILGIPRTALPAKAYPGSLRSGPAVRYFVDKFPVFLDGADASSRGCLTLSYVDAGESSLAGFKHHLSAYTRLFSQLSEFQFLYISNSAVHFGAAGRYFCTFVDRVLRNNPSAELLRYFKLRAAWDEKKYVEFSNESIEWLNNANSRFEGHETERLYAAWRTGQLTDDALANQCGDQQRVHSIHFSPYLVTAHRGTESDLRKTG